MAIHIGKRLREILREQGHTVCWLAEQIPCERSNVYNIFQRPAINTELLATLSSVLNHDFFEELSADWHQDRQEAAATKPNHEP